MTGWMTFWFVLLAANFLAFVGMMVVVGSGAIGEFRETLEDLRQDTQEAAAHPEILDEKT